MPLVQDDLQDQQRDRMTSDLEPNGPTDLQDQQRDRRTSDQEPGGLTATDGEDEWWIVLIDDLT
jgi:hypothetical protein